MVEVVAYDPDWPRRFAELRSRYADALDAAGAPWVAIEHVGSTAVAGLAAKPILDIDIVVAPAEVDAATAALESIGLISRGDLGVEARYAFEVPEGFGPTHTYVVVAGSLALRNHLAVRDVLRRDPDLLREYAEVKRAAAASSADIDEYILQKSDVLERILHRAGMSDEDRAAILETNRRITGRGARG